jgi:membrane dipeptidase
MPLIDLHVDTITALYSDPSDSSRDEFALTNFQDLRSNGLQVDLDKLQQGQVIAQFFVLWLNLRKCQQHQVKPWEHFLKLYRQLHTQVSLNSDAIAIATNWQEIQALTAASKIAALIAIEEGGVITSISELDQAYRLGVRYITLVWNFETHIGVPAVVDQHRGLKPFGLELVAAMQERKMLIDVSHLSDQGVEDVLACTQDPIIASHSNARVLCEHPRNLPDRLIRGIANTGGVIGVNCVPMFLAPQGRKICGKLIAAHLWHIYQAAGEDVLAIGSDFDGFSSKSPDDDFSSIADLVQLAPYLQAVGFSARQIDKIMYRNCQRVIKQVLSAS